ncbi:hypothetical protein PVAR5_8792 [Paecilomyces variotii No. 5]|uniref:Uncharacterized protein n=1 Tax=Byssochlamys spectabilis (strain No. 5 / NBRC 109023) TaxID=1356009 RepID=V5GD95_BYSSN|nr:hypothetical protein PVAR5_8792 [Paecilomyces variotii No. 5]
MRSEELASVTRRGGKQLVRGTQMQGLETGDSTHPQASFPAIGAIIVGQRADDLVVGIGDRKGAGQGSSWWHGLHVSTASAQSLWSFAALPSSRQLPSCWSSPELRGPAGGGELGLPTWLAAKTPTTAPQPASSTASVPVPGQPDRRVAEKKKGGKFDTGPGGARESPMTAPGMIRLFSNGRAVWTWWRVCCPIRPRESAQSSRQFSSIPYPMFAGENCITVICHHQKEHTFTAASMPVKIETMPQETGAPWWNDLNLSIANSGAASGPSSTGSIRLDDHWFWAANAPAPTAIGAILSGEKKLKLCYRLSARFSTRPDPHQALAQGMSG